MLVNDFLRVNVDAIRAFLASAVGVDSYNLAANTAILRHSMRMLIVCNREHFRALRGERSQRELAEQAKCHQPCISDLERGTIVRNSTTTVLRTLHMYAKLEREIANARAHEDGETSNSVHHEGP